MPLPFPVLSGGIMLISPYIFLHSILALKSVVLLNLLGFASLILIFLRNRWICRYACPLGVVCDWASNMRKNKVISLSLNKYLAIISLALAITGLPVLIVLDPFNIFHMSMEVFRTGFHFQALIKVSLLLSIVLISAIMPNIWCRNLCPLGGLQILITDLKNVIRKPGTQQNTRVFNRRIFIAALSGIVAGIIIPRNSLFSHGKRIRPPSALPEPDINLICARCGNCSSACPTNIIKQSDNTRKIGSLLTPVIDFTESYCLPDCTLCGDVCPSGAIQKFTEADKKDLFMGRAIINVDVCYLQYQRECDLCRYHCAYDAIEIKKTGVSQLALPIIVENKCVGCGACKIICPADAFEMIV